MATQRLNPINIDYQTPTDVAGFAGQRAAVSEAEAISQNQTRKISEAQSVVSQHLKAQETFARIGQTQQQLQLETAKQVHNQRMQNEELNMMKQKMPLELAAMDAEIESKRIDNKYAESDNIAKIRGLQLQNRMAEESLDKYNKEQDEISELGGYESGLQAWVDAGNDPDNFRYGFTPETEAGRKFKADILKRVKTQSRVKEIDTETDSLSEMYKGLDGGQKGILDSVKNGKSLYRSESGGYNDDGKEILRGWSRLSALQFTLAEKEEFIKDARSTLWSSGRSERWGKMIDGTFVPTAEGLAELSRRRKAVQESMTQTGMTQKSDGTWEKTFESSQEIWSDAYGKNLDRVMDDEDFTGNAKVEARNLTLMQVGLNVDKTTPGQREAARNADRPMFEMVDGKPVQISGTGDLVNTDPNAVPATSAEANQTNDLNQATTDLAASFKNDAGEYRVDITKSSAKKMLDAKAEVTWNDIKNHTNEFDEDEFNESLYSKKHRHYEQFVREGKASENVTSPETLGYNMPPALAELAIKHALLEEDKAGWGNNDSSDPDKVLKVGVDNFARTLNKPRESLATMIGMSQGLVGTSDWEGTQEAVAAIRALEGGAAADAHPDAGVNYMVREADEIITSEIKNATVRVGVWKRPPTIQSYNRRMTELVKSGEEHKARMSLRGPARTAEHLNVKKGSKLAIDFEYGNIQFRNESADTYSFKEEGEASSKAGWTHSYTGGNITVKELLALPPEKWSGMTLRLPIQHEKTLDVGLPNEVGSGHLQTHGRKQDTISFTFDSRAHNLGEMRAVLTRLVNRSATLEDMYGYIRKNPTKADY